MSGWYSIGKSVRCLECPAGHKCPTTDVSEAIVKTVMKTLCSGNSQYLDHVQSSVFINPLKVEDSANSQKFPLVSF